MKNIVLMVVLALSMLTVGCSTNNSDSDRLKYSAIIKAQEAATKPLFEMECPKEGCVFKKISVANPNPKMMKIPKDTNGWDFANRVVGAVTTITPWLVVGNIAKEGIKHAGDNYNGSHNTSNTNDSINNSHNDSSSSDSSSAVSDSNNTASTTETNTETVTDSYNPSDTFSDSYNSDSYNPTNPVETTTVDMPTEVPSGTPDVEVEPAAS